LDRDALARRSVADDAELAGRDLEAEAAALDARPLAGDFDQLAADAPARHLDQVARDGGTRGRRLGLDGPLLSGDLLARLAHEGTQHGGLGAAAQLLEQRPPPRLELAQEAARGVQVLGPAAPL